MILKITHKMILAFVLIVIVFGAVSLHIVSLLTASLNDITEIHSIRDKSQSLEISAHDLFSITKNYLLIDDVQDEEDFRSEWAKALYTLNAKLKELEEYDIDPNTLSTIRRNIETGSEISDKLTDVHNLLIVSRGKENYDTLKQEEQVLLMNINEIQSETDEATGHITRVTNERLQAAKEKNTFILTVYQLTLPISLIISVIFAILLSYSILNPLNKLKMGVEKIEEGKLNMKVGTDSKDEIGMLSRSFDNMMITIRNSRKGIESSNKQLEQEVKKRTSELENSKKDLEKRVQERTSELENSKKDLEKRVQERTRDLENKVKELEKVNKVTIGRELKMIEMKKQLNKLNSRK